MSFLRALTVGAFGITIFLAVLVEGVVVSRADVGYVFSKPGRLVRTILAMNVLGPIVAIIVCRLFALHPAVIVALVTLSMTPVGALFPQGMLGLVRPERGAHAHGLFVATTLLSVVLTPLAIEVINVLYGEDLHLSPLTVASVAVGACCFRSALGVSSDASSRPRSGGFLRFSKRADVCSFCALSVSRSWAGLGWL